MPDWSDTKLSVLSQRLVQLFLREETVRVITAGNAILQKGHLFEVLVDLQHAAAAAAAASEPQQVRAYSCMLPLTSNSFYVV